MGFSVAIGHIQEVGGMVPGGFCGEATEVFHEGIRVPPVKIKKRGEDNVEVWKLLLANVRTPRVNYGDLRALIAAVDLGESRTVQVIRKYGKAVFRETIRDLLDYSERRMRAELEAIPDGIYGFKDYIESDGVDATIVNVDYPGPEVGGNTETHPRIVGTIMGAMAKAVPNRTMAAEGGTHSNLVFGGVDAETGDFFICYDIAGVGWGGRAFADGNDAVDSINGNCRPTPIEVFETRFPWRVEYLAFDTDSAGAGKFRGGVGYTKQMICLNDEIICSQMTDRHVFAPWGLHGGKQGGLGATLILKAATQEWQNMRQAFGKKSTSRYSNVRITKGDRLRLVSPGGGGYGEPKDRQRELIVSDIKQGYVSLLGAEREYGYSEEQHEIL